MYHPSLNDTMVFTKRKKSLNDIVDKIFFVCKSFEFDMCSSRKYIFKNNEYK